MGKPSKTLSIKNLYLMRDKWLKGISGSKLQKGTAFVCVTAFIEYVNSNRNS
jgi:hypothetical protein